MTAFVALLRAVNVGGTGKLPMTELKAMCEACGFEKVKTYIASGNVVFTSKLSEPKVKAALEARLKDFAGKPIPVMVRTLAEMEKVRDANPFPDAPGNRTIAIFLDAAPPEGWKQGISQKADDEEVGPAGPRELYVRYGHGMGTSKLKIKAAKDGTARNMNTIAKLCELAKAL